MVLSRENSFSCPEGINMEAQKKMLFWIVVVIQNIVVSLKVVGGGDILTPMCKIRRAVKQRQHRLCSGSHEEESHSAD